MQTGQPGPLDQLQADRVAGAASSTSPVPSASTRSMRMGMPRHMIPFSRRAAVPARRPRAHPTRPAPRGPPRRAGARRARRQREGRRRARRCAAATSSGVRAGRRRRRCGSPGRPPRARPPRPGSTRGRRSRAGGWTAARGGARVVGVRDDERVAARRQPHRLQLPPGDAGQAVVADEQRLRTPRARGLEQHPHQVPRRRLVPDHGELAPPRRAGDPVAGRLPLHGRLHAVRLAAQSTARRCAPPRAPGPWPGR